MNKNILTYGTFDTLHYGHINLLVRAKKLAKDGKLIVFLSTDDFNKLKGKQSFLSYTQRKKILQEIKCVDLILPEKTWEQKINDFKKYKAKAIVMGDDWKNDKHFKTIKNEVNIVFLARTKIISSSIIKTAIKTQGMNHYKK